MLPNKLRLKVMLPNKLRLDIGFSLEEFVCAKRTQKFSDLLITEFLRALNSFLSRKQIGLMPYMAYITKLDTPLATSRF